MGLSLVARRAALIASSIAVLGLLVALPSPAAASHVECGDVLTESTTLDNDLVNCPGDGLVIGANDVTLNLAGHTIDGQPTRDETSAVAGDVDGLRIANGTLRGFDGGISLTTSDSVIRDLAADGVFGGITLKGDRNRVQGTDAFGQIQSIGVSGNGNTVVHNRVTGDLTGSYSEFAIALTGHENLVADNRIVGARTAIELFDAVATLVRRNVMSQGLFGVSVHGEDNRIVRNLAIGNGDSAAYGTGISVLEGATGSVVQHNTTNRNGDGIVVLNSDTVVTKNTANFNTNLGINAIAGTVDGGGNRARGNGNPAQCVNVDCR